MEHIFSLIGVTGGRKSEYLCLTEGGVWEPTHRLNARFAVFGQITKCFYVDVILQAHRIVVIRMSEFSFITNKQQKETRENLLNKYVW